MTIEYEIDENDFLTHQLYVASKSDRIKKKRRRSKMILPIIYIALGLLAYFEGRYQITIIFFSIGLLWFFIYPIWERRHYINHYKGFIKENYKERLNRSATLVFSNDVIIAKDNGSESNLLTTELAEIVETPSTIFVRLKGGQSFILPKNKINDFDRLTLSLKEPSNHLNIKYTIDEKWE